MKFSGALAEELTVYANTPVKKAADNLLRTPAGSVDADKIIFATHYPFINFPGMHFFRMHQERSYVIALEGAGNIRGMYIGDGPDALSFRQFGKYLLLKDLVCERENPYTEVFTPSRFSAEEIPQIAKDSRRAVKGLAKRFFHLPGDTINMIEPGHAAVVETPEGRAGVYKSEDNQI